MKRIRNGLILLIYLVFSFHFVLTPNFFVNAAIRKIVVVEDTEVRVRTGPGTKYDIIVQLPNRGDSFTYLGQANDEGGCAGNVWYKVQYNPTTVGYICSQFTGLYEIDDSNEFPQDYQVLIKQLQAKYPNWVFVPYHTGRTFEQATRQQLYRSNIENRTYINGVLKSSEGLRLTEPGYYDFYTDTYVPQDGNNWFAANLETIAYFMDPRNFINVDDIWMFEQLSFNDSVHTREMIYKLFQGTEGEQYIDYIMNAARDYSVSPIHLASRIIQESMSGGKFGVSGHGQGSSCKYIGTDGNEVEIKAPAGIYNFFNIKATDGKCPAQRGLLWASGETASEYAKQHYNLPWDTPEKAIRGGALFLSEDYIAKGQDTLYFQKFNVLIGGNVGHQYMTNVKAHYSETANVYKAYKNINALDESFVFIIPVYNNMPEKTSLPPLGSPNNFLKNLAIDGVNISNFNGALTSYEVIVPALTTAVTISGSTVNSKATVSGLGQVILTGAETDINIKVTAENGDVKIYTIKVKKASSTNIPVETIVNKLNLTIKNNYLSGIKLGTTSEGFISNLSNITNEANAIIKDVNGVVKNSSKISTGDKIIITTGSDIKEYTAVIYGDVNGDGNIDIVDLLRVQKYLLGTSKLSEHFILASDTNKDEKVDIVDLLRIQKHILGTISIQQ